MSAPMGGDGRGYHTDPDNPYWMTKLTPQFVIQLVLLPVFVNLWSQS